LSRPVEETKTKALHRQRAFLGACLDSHDSQSSRIRNQSLFASAQGQSGALAAWGPEALAEAKRLNKPVLVSVGYAACHWCHVMAHESFEDPETAALMNELYVCIKVDREERPTSTTGCSVFSSFSAGTAAGR